MVLWLVPSNAILKQTLDALKDKRHPYRQALESSCGSDTVLNVGETLSLTRYLFTMPNGPDFNVVRSLLMN